MILQSLNRYRNLGLLILRVGFGLYMALVHGWGKIMGGPEAWAGLGSTMGTLFGIGFLPTFWGFMAAIAEFVGGLLVVAGFFTRPATALLVINMGVAALSHIMGEGSPESALLYGFVFLALFFTGPGKYSLDASFGSNSSQMRGSSRF